MHSCVEKGVEQSFKGPDKLGCTDSATRDYLLPKDVVFEIWTSVLKESVKIKIFPTYAEARQAGGKSLVGSGVRIETENFRTYSKPRNLSLFCPERLVCKSIQQRLHGVRLGNEVFPDLVDLVDRSLH